MCLIVLAHEVREDYPLIIVANRDEFLDRPTVAAHRWEDKPLIFGGRDLRAGGTWLGISDSGKVAAVTNFRDLRDQRTYTSSRGNLVTAFLESEQGVVAHLQTLNNIGHEFDGYNLLVWDGEKLGYGSNRSGNHPQLVDPGIHGLSNALLNTPWPKVERAKRMLSEQIAKRDLNAGELLDMVFDLRRAEDEKLPDTGIGLEKERALSSMFIKMSGYGTRCSSVVLIDANGLLTFIERRYDGQTNIVGESKHEQQVQLHS